MDNEKLALELTKSWFNFMGLNNISDSSIRFQVKQTDLYATYQRILKQIEEDKN
ncbi:hypothetical protein [Fructilactobacillus lindneri]|uniref:Uncharacterized protein n=1 Tax=Fructilactobacillus lindneri DSM 20690 = JCM 11027 TaxID=1122148 RepID=A0A0R2JM99_9LACO|nr:hypothetical protein [Fructilactobacillus lindneri]KRN78323.1 hypothetical protein IV52_GL001260 [Fructilactobacillus lindneri DSM 20690 = JCM 11027]SKA08331.1 hypothetical protein SAMN02746042_01431 [Fructilactobacillus lindneri DSM 20690 = JCM 11027]